MKDKGITLIELMILVAIVSMLIAIAVRGWEKYQNEQSYDGGGYDNSYVIQETPKPKVEVFDVGQCVHHKLDREGDMEGIVTDADHYHHGSLYKVRFEIGASTQQYTPEELRSC